MTAPGPDPATRPPSEGGWFRFAGEPPDTGPSDTGPSDTGQPDAGPLTRPEEAGDPSGATWDPIPSFQTSDQPAPPGAVSEAWPAWPTWPATTMPEARPARRRRRLPEEPVEYPQLLRGPTRAWWRPVLCLVVFVALFAILSVLPALVVLAYGLLSGVDDPSLWLDEQLADDAVLDPGGYLYLNLALAVLIPAAMLSIWAVHRIRPRYLSSVAGGLRWRWLLRCVAVLAPLFAVYLTLSTLTDPPQSARSASWVALLVIGVLLTPWQAAAEEYAFRGWLTQNLGAYLARPLVAVVLPAVVVAAAFAAAHGSPDPWILAELAVFSLAASFMTWRTGGLEAAIVMHAANNVGIDVITNVVGGFDETFVGAETTGTPLSLAVSLLVHGLAVLLVLWQARRCGLNRRFRPTAAEPVRRASWSGRIRGMPSR